MLIILQVFFVIRAVLKIGEYTNNSLHLARKNPRIFVCGHYLFREHSSRKTLSFEEAKINSRELEAIVFIILKIFRNPRSFENWGIFNNYSMSARWI